MSVLSALWHWTFIVLAGIGFLCVLSSAALVVLVASSASRGSVPGGRRWERRFSREIIREVAGLTPEEVREWLS